MRNRAQPGETPYSQLARSGYYHIAVLDIEGCYEIRCDAPDYSPCWQSWNGEELTMEDTCQVVLLLSKVELTRDNITGQIHAPIDVYQDKDLVWHGRMIGDPILQRRKNEE